MRKLLKDNHGDIGAIGMAVAIIVTLVVSLLIVYNVALALDMSTVDHKIASNVYGHAPPGVDVSGDGSNDPYNRTQYGANATDSILEQSETFYTIAPLVVIILIAVVILGYVMQLARRPGP